MLPYQLLDLGVVGALGEFERRGRDEVGLLEPADVAATILHALTLPRTAEITDLDIRPLTPPSPPST